MTDMIGGEVEKHSNVCVGEPVVDASAIAAGAHDIGGTKQAHRLRDDVLADVDNIGNVADAELTANKERVEDRETGRIAQKSK